MVRQERQGGYAYAGGIFNFIVSVQATERARYALEQQAVVARELSASEIEVESWLPMRFVHRSGKETTLVVVFTHYPLYTNGYRKEGSEFPNGWKPPSMPEKKKS